MCLNSSSKLEETNFHPVVLYRFVHGISYHHFYHLFLSAVVDALDGFAVNEHRATVPQQDSADISTAGRDHDLNLKYTKNSTDRKAYVESSNDRPMRHAANAVGDHKGNDHSRRHKSSAEATSSTRLKFDPLGGGARKGKKSSEIPSDMEQELNMLMKELLSGSGETPDGILGTDASSSMKDTLDALKASGLGSHENGNGQGSTVEEDSISSALVDGIMRQLLSKEILYQPMKEIGERYPPWLEEHKGSLDSEEYATYTRQYKYIQEICGIYESDPDNFNGLMALLQEMQECGQPPQEIIDELSPEDASSFASSLTGGSSPGGQCVII